jgi:hypothetical protein
MTPLQLIVFNLAVSWGLSILIWLVQVIIYPGFVRIPAGKFVDYHHWYVKRITIIVLPLMVSEVLLTAMWLLDAPAPGSIISSVLVLVVWFSTFVFQVPIHGRLKSGKDTALIRRLVATNWIRTGAWSLKALIVTVVLIGGSFHLI